jgi:hypothetical protein
VLRGAVDYGEEEAAVDDAEVCVAVAVFAGPDVLSPPPQPGTASRASAASIAAVPSVVSRLFMILVLSNRRSRSMRPACTGGISRMLQCRCHQVEGIK